jgi:hypothetical protein
VRRSRSPSSPTRRGTPVANAVLKGGEVLDFIRGEIHRRGLRDAQAKAREARLIAIGALLLATVVGVAQIIVAIATA